MLQLSFEFSGIGRVTRLIALTRCRGVFLRNANPSSLYDEPAKNDNIFVFPVSE
jgi:hypothetical protein